MSHIPLYPQAALAWPVQGTPSVTSGSKAGVGELDGFVVKIPKYSLATLGIIPGSAICFLDEFASPHFPQVSVLPTENFGQEA